MPIAMVVELGTFFGDMDNGEAFWLFMDSNHGSFLVREILSGDCGQADAFLYLVIQN